MRLGQLARKLSLRPSQIVEFLGQQNIKIEETSNTRMEESHVLLVVQKYAPESLADVVAEADEIEIIEENEESSIVEGPLQDVEESVEQTKVPASQESELEVIRVPKIELLGLKVLGKIELPETKKKDSTIDGQIAGPVSTEEQPVRQSPRSGKGKSKSAHHKHERSQQHTRKNPIELQREREVQEAEERRKIALEREKERRKTYYEERIKTLAQAKRIKQVKEEPKIETKPVNQPTTWLGKFFGWWIRK